MDSLSDIDFRDYYENKHAPLASSLLTLEGYERNYVNSELNPLYASLGSISIFQYQSMQSLEVVGKEMSSSAGDNFEMMSKNLWMYQKIIMFSLSQIN